MNKEELKTVLQREGIDSRFYSLHGLAGSSYDDVQILEQEGSKWIVYYVERGEKSQIHLFNTENEACLFLLEKLRRDPTTRIKK